MALLPFVVASFSLEEEEEEEEDADPRERRPAAPPEALGASAREKGRERTNQVNSRPSCLFFDLFFCFVNFLFRAFCFFFVTELTRGPLLQPRPRSRSSLSLFALAALSSLSLFRAPSKSLGMLVMPPPGGAATGDPEEEEGADELEEEKNGAAAEEEEEEEAKGEGKPPPPPPPPTLDCFPISTRGAPTIPGLSAGPSGAYPADA